MKKILIISATPPGWQGGGGVLIQSLIEGYGVDNFCYYCPKKIWEKDNYQLPDALSDMPVKFGSLRILHLHKRRHKLFFLLEEIILFFLLIKRKREILKFAQENNVDLIWATLRGDALFFVNYLNRKLKINFVASVQDPVESEWKDRKILYWIKKRNYYKAIRNASFLAAAGESMVEFFKTEFDRDSVIQRKGVVITHNHVVTPNEPFKENGINIAFAGSIYTSEIFEPFLDALNQFLDSYKEYHVVLNIFSNDRLHNNNKHDRLKIIFNPWETEENLKNKISKMDFGYLPYKFAKKDKVQMQQSFPNKIIVYLIAQIPVFFHGPSYSSVNRFFDKYPCGVSCDSLQKENIVSVLESLVFDKNKYYNYVKTGRRALVEAFDEQKIFEEFDFFIKQGLLKY